jgi:hypothetical protein
MYGGAGNNGGYGAAAPRLEPSQLFEKRAQRDRAKLRAYNEILGQIHTRIYNVSQMTGNTSSLVYTVPPFILGMPALDLQDCIVYLVSMLRNSGFEVKYTYPNLLYISWKHYETQYNREVNPIVQAMMPPALPVNTTKKGKEGKRGMGDKAPSVTFAPLPPMDTARPPPRSAADYQPPDSFLNELSRPSGAPRAPASGLPAGAGAPRGSGSSGQAPSQATANVLADLWTF